MQKTKIAIITPYKNSSQFLDSYFNSLLSQTYKNWNCYLVNDGSIDNSNHLIGKITRNDSRFILLDSSKDKISLGPATSRNIGLSIGTEPLVCFLDIDDLWEPNKLDLQLRFFIENDLDICVTSYFKFKDKKLNSKLLINPPLELDYKELLNKNHIPLLTVLVKRDLKDFYFPNSRHEDYAMWLNIFLRNPKIKYGNLNQPLCYYRIHNNNITSNKIKMIFWIYEAYKIHGINNKKSIFLVIRTIILHFCKILESYFKIRKIKHYFFISKK